MQTRVFTLVPKVFALCLQGFSSKITKQKNIEFQLVNDTPSITLISSKKVKGSRQKHTDVHHVLIKLYTENKHTLIRFCTYYALKNAAFADKLAV